MGHGSRRAVSCLPPASSIAGAAVPRAPWPRLPTVLLCSTDAFASGQESTDSSLRYAAYANRLRTIMLSAHRYVAYTSDIGESFRPIAHPILVRGAYAVSWSYLIGDVAHEGYKAYIRQQALLHPERRPGEIAQRAVDASVGGEGPVYGHVPAIEDYRAVMAQRAVFQSLASMGLPAFTIHSIVRYSGRALKDTKNVAIRTWGPIGVSVPDALRLGTVLTRPI